MCSCQKIGKMKRHKAHKTRKHYSRRSRVGSLSASGAKNTLIQAASVGAGLYVGGILGELDFLKSSGYVRAAAKIAAGVVLSGMSNSMLSGLGVGIAASGLLSGASHAGLKLPAIAGPYPFRGQQQVNGSLPYRGVNSAPIANPNVVI